MVGLVVGAAATGVGEDTATIIDRVAEPTGLVAVSVYFVVDEGVAVAVPEDGTLPPPVI